MASTINASTSAGLVNTADTSGVLQLQTANTTAVTIDTSQRIGIGGTPSAWSASPFSPVMQFGSTGNITTVSGANGSVNLFNNCYYNGSNYIYQVTDYATRYATGNGGNHIWYYAPSGTAGNAITFTEAMRIDSSGNLLVGTTNASGRIATEGATDTYNLLSLRDTGTNYTTSNRYAIFYNSTSGVAGAIQHTAASSVTYATSSDERLKENIIDSPNALNKINQIPVRSYDWKEDKFHVEYGFVAQELVEIYAEPVGIGGDDAKENPWNIEYGRLTPILVKAIQELKAINDTQAETINALTARIVALEQA